MATKIYSVASRTRPTPDPDVSIDVGIVDVPQSQPLDETQVENSAGGFVYETGSDTHLNRFLILGSDSQTYYTTAQDLTKQNVGFIRELLRKNGPATIMQVVAVSESGRAPKNDPAILVLALAFEVGDLVTKAVAAQALPKICRTGYHLFRFVEFVNGLRGWGRGLRKAVGNWYTSQSPSHLAFQVTKYQQREGWSHRDVLRLAHTKPEEKDIQKILRYVVKGELPYSTFVYPSNGGAPTYETDAFAVIHGMENVKKYDKARDVAHDIEAYGLQREHIPTQFLNSTEVWEALLAKMPATALIRNLSKLGSLKMLDSLDDTTKLVLDKLHDHQGLIKARVHPITLLSALRVYEGGHGLKGSLSWKPNSRVSAALEEAFYGTFKSVEPTGKRIMLALDVSGSMGGGVVAGVPGLTPRDACAAMALVTNKVEDRVIVKAFTTSLTDFPIDPRATIKSVIEAMARQPYGGTDCSQPMVWARQTRTPIDTFVIYTDNETWTGGVHPSKALQHYRKDTGIDAKLAVIAFTSTGFSIADTNDSGMMDFVGFDSAVPQVLGMFMKGEV